MGGGRGRCLEGTKEMFKMMKHGVEKCIKEERKEVSGMKMNRRIQSRCDERKEDRQKGMKPARQEKRREKLNKGKTEQGK